MAAASIRIEPMNSSRFFSGFFQPLDVFLDVAGHFVEVFSKFTDFRSAAHGER